LRSIRFAPGPLARVFGVLLLGAALTVGSAGIAPERAAAQITHVHPDGKGIIGLGLIGAELGLFIPAIVQNSTRSNEWWPYLVFPLIGAAGGAVGGYFLEQGTQSSPEIDVAFMVAGMVLIVPTVIGTLALAAYSPPAETVGADEDMTVDEGSDEDSVEAVQEDTTETEAAPSDSSTTPATAPQSRRETRASDLLAGGTGLLRFDADTHRVLLGVPVVGATPTYTAEEIAHLHLTQTYDVHIPVVSATF
jgi:hypothetical protein